VPVIFFEASENGRQKHVIINCVGLHATRLYTAAEWG